MQSKQQLLRHDRGFLQSNLKYLNELSTKVAQYADDSRAEAAAAAEARAAEAARRQAVVSMRATLADQKAANLARAARKASLEERLTNLKVRHLRLIKRAGPGLVAVKHFINSRWSKGRAKRTGRDPPISTARAVVSTAVMLQAQHAVLGSQRCQVQARLVQLQADAHASQQAITALADRSVTAEALLAKARPHSSWHSQTGAHSGGLDLESLCNASCVQWCQLELHRWQSTGGSR